MITELFGRKIINFATPYKRSFITIEPVSSEIPRAITLPSIKSAVFFLNQGDMIVLDNINELETLCYIDYDLINQKDKSLVKYFDDFHLFKETVKTAITNEGYLAMEVVRKVIYSDVIHIACNLIGLPSVTTQVQEHVLEPIQNSQQDDYRQYQPATTGV